MLRKIEEMKQPIRFEHPRKDNINKYFIIYEKSSYPENPRAETLGECAWVHNTYELYNYELSFIFIAMAI